MSRVPTVSDEAACRRLVVEFAHHLDHRRFSDVADLFAEDGVWVRHGERLVGPAAISQMLSGRPATQIERHVMTTILIDSESDTECSGVSYALIFRDGHGVGTGQPVIGEFHDRFRRSASGWQFTQRSSTPAFAVEESR